MVGIFGSIAGNIKKKSNEYSIRGRNEKGIVSQYSFIGNGGFAQYMYFNVSTSHLSDCLVSHILIYLEYKDSLMLNK